MLPPERLITSSKGMTDFEAHILTIDLRGIDSRAAANISVQIELVDEALVALASVPPQTLWPGPTSGMTDAKGEFHTRLLPSEIVGSDYKITVGGYERVITMPAEDARLSGLGDPVRSTDEPIPNPRL